MTNPRNYIYLLRMVLVISLILTGFLFIYGRYDYALFVIFFLACGSIIHISTSSISKDFLVISKHYLYGFLRSKSYVRLDDIEKIIPVNMEFSDSVNSSSDDIIAVLSSTFNTANVEIYEIKWKDKHGISRNTKINRHQYSELMNTLKVR